jgi:hypothetical protein
LLLQFTNQITVQKLNMEKPEEIYHTQANNGALHARTQPNIAQTPPDPTP